MQVTRQTAEPEQQDKKRSQEEQPEEDSTPKCSLAMGTAA